MANQNDEFEGKIEKLKFVDPSNFDFEYRTLKLSIQNEISRDLKSLEVMLFQLKS